jgi:hypothetical protein
MFSRKDFLDAFLMDWKCLFEIIWEDPVGGKSFYGSWLDEEKCFDVTANPNESFTIRWFCNKGETYSHQGLVTSKIKRTAHLYIGPPPAFVIQEQYIRVEGDGH